MRRQPAPGRTGRHSGAATPPARGERDGQDGRTVILRYRYSDGVEAREIELSALDVSVRRHLEPDMTMSLTEPMDRYLGVALRRDWSGEVSVLVHANPAMSLPLPPLDEVDPAHQADAWAMLLGVASLDPARPAPRRTGNPLNHRRAAKTRRRRQTPLGAMAPAAPAAREIIAPA